MFGRLGSLTYRFRYLVVAGWIALAAGAVLLAPSLAQEGLTNQSAFLPAGTESVLARDALERAFPGATAASSASLAFARDAGLSDADRAYIAATADWLTSADAPAVVRDAVAGIATVDSRPELAAMLRSADGKLEMVAVNLDVTAAGSGAEAVISAIRDHLGTSAPAGLDAHVTGTAAISTDYLAAIVKGTESTTIVTIVLVVIILLLIYRAPLAALVPLITIGAAFLVSRGVLGVLAAAGWRLSSLLDTFVVVLVFGVGTDYAIFLISRFREEVSHDDWHNASRTTVRRIGAVISASAATVIVGLGSMAFAQFGMIQTMGPALAVAIFVTLVAGLTLTPALLGIFGHYLFWPLHLRTRSDGDPGGFFARLASAVSRRPGIVTLVLLVALLVPALTIGRMQTNFDVLAELPADSDARAGFDQVAAHLGRGKVVQSTGVLSGGSGTDLLAPVSLSRLRDTTSALLATDGVASVTSLVSPDGDGVVPDGFRPSIQLAEMAKGFAGDTGTGSTTEASTVLDPKVDEGLATATEYLALLGNAFPDVRATTGYRDATTDLATARDKVRSARDSAVVSTQLRGLSRTLTSPTAAGGSADGTSVGLMGDYLDELGAAFPAARDARRLRVRAGRRDPARAEGLDRGRAGPLVRPVRPRRPGSTANDPEATLVPQSLAGTTEAKQRRAEMEATFARLETELNGLSTTFATRSDDLFVPVGLTGTAGADAGEGGRPPSCPTTAARPGSTSRPRTTRTPSRRSGPCARRRMSWPRPRPASAPTAGAYLGGPTAEFADVQAVLARDFQQVAIVTIIGILVVLVILLRAVVAPLYLVGTVLLSCATALGLSAWFFQSVLGQAGVSFYLPLLVFVLLVALGSDYNIFLMSRVREESEARPIRDGIRIASGRTGAVITSAGLILAGTFGSMVTAPLIVLAQVGATVAVGVLIDTFIVRSILVPAIATLVGDWSWWPSGARGLGRVAWPISVTIPSLDMPAAAIATANAASDDGAAGGSSRRRRLAVALALVALVPMIFAGLLTWSLSDSTTRLSHVTAAVVNEDEGATTTAADGTVSGLDLGDDLVGRLTAGSGGDTFTWRATDAAVAHDGLTTGRYAAVLTIPTDFSRTIAAIRAAGGTAAPKATLRLATSDASGALVGPIARSLSDAIARATAQEVIASYVDDVLLSVGTGQDRLAGAATGAAGVASDATDLSNGASSTSTVAGELVAGLRKLAAGTSAAGAGAKELAAGVTGLASGTGNLATGASSLAEGAQTAADGTGQLASGASSLADGLGSLSTATAGLPAQTKQLATGAGELADGAAAEASGIQQLADSLAAMAAETKGLGAETKTLNSGAQSLADGAKTLKQGAASTASGASDVAAGADALSQNVAGYTGSVADLSANCAALGGTDALCGQLAALAAGGQDLSVGASRLASGAGDVAAGTRQVSAGASDVSAGAADVAAGTAQLAAGAPGLETGIAGAATGADQLASGASDVAAGARALATGTATLAGSAPALAGAVSDAAAGAKDVASGAGQVDAGVTKLANGAQSLASGAQTAASGASRLADGTSLGASGVSQLASGLRAPSTAPGWSPRRPTGSLPTGRRSRRTPSV